jgi:hypothetical protein
MRRDGGFYPIVGLAIVGLPSAAAPLAALGGKPEYLLPQSIRRRPHGGVVNVGNVKTAVSELNPISFLIPSLNRAVVNQPRTIGVELDYAFGGR